MSEPASETDLAVIDAFTFAVVTALRELTQTEAMPADDGSVPPGITNGVVAVMRLQRTVPGSMTLVVSADTARRLAERYLPQGTELTEEIVDDVVGEFANVIAGQAKTMLKGTPCHFLLSLPAVSRSGTAAKQPGVAIRLTCELGEVHLYVELTATKFA